MRKIKKGDIVAIRSGNDKGKVGEILKVIPKDDRVLVAGVNIKTHFNKPQGMNPGSIEKKEAPIHISNVSLINPDLIEKNITKIDSLKGNIVKVGIQMEGNKKFRINKITKVAI